MILEVLLSLAPKAKYKRSKTDKFDYTTLKFFSVAMYDANEVKGKDKPENLFTKYMTAKKMTMTQRAFTNQ